MRFERNAVLIVKVGDEWPRLCIGCCACRRPEVVILAVSYVAVLLPRVLRHVSDAKHPVLLRVQQSCLIVVKLLECLLIEPLHIVAVVTVLPDVVVCLQHRRPCRIVPDANSQFHLACNNHKRPVQFFVGHSQNINNCLTLPPPSDFTKSSTGFRFVLWKIQP